MHSIILLSASSISFSSLCLLCSSVVLDGLCLFHWFDHSLTPFICGVWCLTKFKIRLFLRFLLFELILIYLYPLSKAHIQHTPLYIALHTLTARETQRKITSTQIHWIETVMRLLWKTLELLLFFIAIVLEFQFSQFSIDSHHSTY